MKILNSKSKNFDKLLENLLSKRKQKLKASSVSVTKIINDVKKNGDKALLKYERKFNKNNIVVAYEPIWSIGTGKIPTAHELKKTTIHIKKVLKGIFKKNSPAVLYGGSVDGTNVEMFKEIREIDGFLVGGASKTSKKFIDIIKNYYR